MSLNETSTICWIEKSDLIPATSGANRKWRLRYAPCTFPSTCGRSCPFWNVLGRGCDCGWRTDCPSLRLRRRLRGCRHNVKLLPADDLGAGGVPGPRRGGPGDGDDLHLLRAFRPGDRHGPRHPDAEDRAAAAALVRGRGARRGAVELLSRPGRA